MEWRQIFYIGENILKIIGWGKALENDNGKIMEKKGQNDKWMIMKTTENNYLDQCDIFKIVF